jgi:hypothetical protein
MNAAQRVESLGQEDIDTLEAQRAWVREHYSPETRHEYATLAGKLHLLQVIVNSGWIQRDEADKLQCLGITFGDALVESLPLEWVMVEDGYGRDPALRLSGSSALVFPLTMISKRVEKGESVDVLSLYDQICEQVSSIPAASQ